MVPQQQSGVSSNTSIKLRGNVAAVYGNLEGNLLGQLIFTPNPVFDSPAFDDPSQTDFSQIDVLPNTDTIHHFLPRYHIGALKWVLRYVHNIEEYPT